MTEQQLAAFVERWRSMVMKFLMLSIAICWIMCEPLTLAVAEDSQCSDSTDINQHDVVVIGYRASACGYSNVIVLGDYTVADKENQLVVRFKDGTVLKQELPANTTVNLRQLHE